MIRFGFCQRDQDHCTKLKDRFTLRSRDEKIKSRIKMGTVREVLVTLSRSLNCDMWLLLCAYVSITILLTRTKINYFSTVEMRRLDIKNFWNYARIERKSYYNDCLPLA